MAKKQIRLTESDLHRIVKESVLKVLNEENNDSGSHKGNIYYVESEFGREQELIDFLKSQNLNTDAIEAHYFFYKRRAHGELIMWHDGDKYPCFVHLSQEPLVRSCGTKVQW